MKPELVAEMENKIQEHRKYFILVNSWHSSDHESYGMWKAYVSSPEGVCIKTSSERLNRALSVEADPNLQAKVIAVTYGERVKCEPEYLAHFVRKGKPYTFEQEVRAIIDLYPIYGLKSEKWESEQFKDLLLDKGLYVKTNIHELIEKVVVSPFAERWFVSFLRHYLKKCGLSEGLIEESELQQ